MNLPDINELAKVIDLCQKKGVKVFSMGELRLELGEVPVKQKKQKEQTIDENDVDPMDPYAGFPNGILTPEQLVYYSAGGKVGDEPWLKKPGAES